MRLMFPVLLAALSISAAVSAEDANSNTNPIPGTWKVVRLEGLGQSLPYVSNMPQFAFGSERLVSGKPPFNETAVTFKCDQTTNPKTLDIIFLDGKQKGQAILCIYDLNGGTLRLCMPDQTGVPRPTEFKTAVGSAMILLELNRVK